MQKAMEAQRDRDGMGPIYRHLLDHERHLHKRFGVVGQMRRPRHLLDALENGEVVEVAVWKVPFHLRPPGYGPTLVVTPAM